jgi:GNAT superfamily N-acetyltransferase
MRSCGVEIRIARRGDVPAILGLLADDDIARSRGPVSEEADAAVWRAFENIDADPNNELIVGEEAGEVIATCQLTFTPGLSRGGATRMTIEAVRVRKDRRGGGRGKELIAYAVDRARERGCRIVQLTTDKRRSDAQRFYAALGFTASHEGMKLPL